METHTCTTVLVVLTSVVTIAMQPIPRPFPRPGNTITESSLEEPQVQAPLDETLAVSASDIPSEATLGFPIYPNANYLRSYDAGRGQNYYLFGTNATYEEMVNYYSIVLKERGNRVFEAPRVHMFEVGRFREDRMAFPPGVTIKDFSWNGSLGYVNPTRQSGGPSHYITVIQIVPNPTTSTP